MTSGYRYIWGAYGPHGPFSQAEGGYFPPRTAINNPAALTPEQAILAAILAGTAYFRAEEAQVPKGANCSYLASPVTDAVATAGGAVCAYRGWKSGDPIVAGFGACVVTIHIWQYLHHKRQG